MVKRTKRFLELLKTIDGIFCQRYLSTPEEMWTWKKFDDFVIISITALLQDEFIDGNFLTSARDYQSKFSNLKQVRKQVKE